MFISLSLLMIVMSEKIEEVSWDEISQEEDIEVIASRETIKKILKKSGNKIDNNGFILKHNEENETANDGLEIKLKELGAVAASSKTFIRNNLASFSDYLASKKTD